MIPIGRTLLLGVLVVGLAGCASMPCEGDADWAVRPCAGPVGSPAAGCDCCKPKKGPKTLLEWAACKDEKGEEKKDEKNGDDKKDDNGKKDENGKKNGDAKNGEKQEAGQNGNGKQNGEEEEEEEDVIQTDRPDFTEASTTVGRGRIQLESGYTYSRDRSNGNTTTGHSYPEALLRIGMFAEWFEWRLGQNYSSTRFESPGFSNKESGPEDLYFGVKLALTEQQKCLPETALILQTTIPSGAGALTVGQLQPGFNYLFGWDVVKDCLSAGGSFQMNRARDGVGHFYVEVAQSFTINYDLTRELTAFTEWFAFYPAGAIDPDTSPVHFFDGGFAYKVTNNFQLDVRGGVGLNDRAADYFVGSGFAVRF